MFGSVESAALCVWICGIVLAAIFLWEYEESKKDAVSFRLMTARVVRDVIIFTAVAILYAFMSKGLGYIGDFLLSPLFVLFR